MSLAAIERPLSPGDGSPYVAYSYAYPHKTAYRPLATAISLADAWREERQDALFLYLHIPFCEHRCGFCNLFTLAQPEASLTRRYLDALRRQAEATRAALPDARFARLAIGGGTPTFLTTEELAELFEIITGVMGARPRAIPVSCEASPATVDAEKLALLRKSGVDRLSLGIESFSERDAHAMGRPQQSATVAQALRLVRDAGFPIINLDLIYGAESQTTASWLASVQQAIDFAAEEIYLYPLYVRPLTGLGKSARTWDDWRLALYRAGRERLLESGYEQVSLRMFRRPLANESGPVYCCQDDGMIGLGCGARSYTRSLHYSREYAVASRAVAGILADYLQRTHDDFGRIDYGIHLDADEQRRRWLIMSLLQVEGVARAAYRLRFGADALAEFPQLGELAPAGLATINDARIVLTPAGLERSDAIGPWLYSPAVQRLTEDYAWR
jgi:oxygen-independent coproporphyrinogen-3 oxidase